ncbi:MAG: toxin [Desulfobacula sp.]|nr:toxin [Desulfobacula sp.]
MISFKWNAEKNEILAKERGITFEEIVQRIDAGAIVINTEHPNKEQYPNQKIMIIDVEGYAYIVPYVIDGNIFFLKTIIPSRKATKKYLGGKNDEENKNNT